ncbi:glycosyltransferase family 2 protein [Rhodococcus sp. ABRD24]|uniref:glycosyltransferase family 2 protein n=1 Tax=Rhodococcus sp. ABRD24 TaxID=2507582 RepID=UPI001039C2FF|nr:glycosyltransferase family 2 protein [Rhodococcus sp. ABRD24]QBJ97632.1 glycosyltransferase family 2 protein [Rhodococcus sp. ABRD24]
MNGPDVEAATSLSVVVCAYTTERWSDLSAAVRSVLDQRQAVHELLVVIDHCDELFERASAQYGDNLSVRVLENAEARGLSGARNTGVRAATGAVVAFLDDDAVAAPDWAESLLVHYDDPDVMGVGGYVAPRWPKSRPNWMPPEFDWVVGCSYVGQPLAVAPVRNFIGCNMSLRRTVFADVGGFDDAVGRVASKPAGCEETELCIRVRSRHRSARLLHDPAVRVTHRVTEPRTTFRYFVRRCYHEGISKAVVTELAGSRDALSSEREYTTRVLPRAVVTGLRSPSDGGLARVGAVLAGLVVTIAGYSRGRTARRLCRGAGYV